jgi:hypothetical protein
MSGLLLRQQKTRGSGKHARNRKMNAIATALMAPVAISFAAILLTTLVLFLIQSYLATEHLLLVYLLPTIFIAIYFGSTVAVLTSLVVGSPPPTFYCRRNSAFISLILSTLRN